MTSIELAEGKIIVRAAEGEAVIDLGSALRVKMYDRPETRYYQADGFAIKGVYPLADGIKVHLANEREGLYIPLIIKPTADGFRAIVPAGQIVEQYGINRKLMELSILPNLMQSNVGDEGFFLLPCFCGLLVRFKAHTPSINRDRLYMDQAEWEKLNVLNCFAMNRAGKGILAMAHKGDFACLVTTELNQQGENRIFPSFILRKGEGQVVKQEDKEVVYAFSSGKDAEYTRMALRYHKYLRDERGASPLKDRIGSNPVLAYSVDAMRVKIFHGCKQPSRPDGSGEFKSAATFAQAEKIMESMKASGIERAVVTLVGWNLGGHDGAYPTRFPIEPKLGGEAGLRKLIAKALELGYQIVPHDNYTDIYRSSPDFDYEYVARTAEGEPRVVGVWSGGQSYKACPTVYLDRYGCDVDRIKEMGFSGHYYCDAQNTVMWDCHNPRHPADEEQFAISLAKMTQLHRAIFGAVSIELASAFSIPFIDEVATVPLLDKGDWVLNRLPAQFKDMIDRAVPFYHIALHGLVTYQQAWVHQWRKRQGGVKRGLLRTLAYGGRPSMEVSYERTGGMDYYEDSIKDVMEGYRRAFVDMKGFHVEPMAEFEELAPEAARVSYANGRSVTVNWGEESAAGLAPLSYKLD